MHLGAMAPSQTRALQAAVALLVAAATARFALQHVGSLYDDAFIYFRYARVAREGCFYCFNPGGPRVEGVTSPLYFLLILAASVAGSRYFVAATVLGALGVTVGLGAAPVRAASLVRGRVAALSAVAVLTTLCLDDWFQLNAVTGLETAVAMALLTLTACSALTPGHPGLGALSVLASLARPEATLAVVLLPALPSMRSARRLGPPFAALAAFALARLALFGDLVPNTYHAKSGGDLAHALAGARYLGEVISAEPLCLLAPAALLSPVTREGGRYVLAIALLWFGFFLRSGGDHFFYGRLAAPLVPAMILVGVAGLFDRLASRRALVAGLGAAMVALTLWRSASHRVGAQHGFPNVHRWILVGRALRAHYPGATLATVPIGAIGYYSHARVIDLVGLTEPAIARRGQRVPESAFRRHWIGHERFNTPWVLAQRPDVIVTSLWRDRPWRTLDEARPGFYADRELWEAMRAGRAPYEVRDLEVEPGLHWLLYVRRADADRASE